MAKFRRWSPIVEATQWFHHGDHPKVQRYPNEENEGTVISPWGWAKIGGRWHIIEPSDWIVTGSKEELYHYRVAEFLILYEPYTQ